MRWVIDAGRGKEVRDEIDSLNVSTEVIGGREGGVTYGFCALLDELA